MDLSSYNHPRAHALALLSSIMFGVANFLTEDQSAKHGINAVQPQCIGYTLVWIVYQIFSYSYKKPSAYKVNNKYSFWLILIPF